MPFSSKKLFRLAGGILVAAAMTLATILVVRAVNFKPVYADSLDSTLVGVDTVAVAKRLSDLIQFRTVANLDAVDSTAFRGAHEYLAATYPAFASATRREIVGSLSALYQLPGSDRSLAPLLLSGHLDVAAVADSTKWDIPPFDGHVDNQRIWGRGAIDNKGGVIAMMEALEMLLSSGRRPTRTVYVALGHDEEVGGGQGARQITNLLESRGVRLYATIDEGGLVISDALEDVSEPLALVGTAEKGSLNVRLTVEEQDGHSSIPSGQTSIEVLGAAVAVISNISKRERLTEPVLLFLDRTGPLMPFGKRLVLSNRWLFGALMKRQMMQTPQTAAMIQTTFATTGISGGFAVNALPQEAHATINIRLLPGDHPDDIIQFITDTISDSRVTVDILGKPLEASRVSPTDSKPYSTIETIASGLSSQGPIIVSPFLFIAGTDSKHYQRISDSVYRFSGMSVTGSDLERIHGVNESISIDGLISSIRFYYHFVEIEAMSGVPN